MLITIHGRQFLTQSFNLPTSPYLMPMMANNTPENPIVAYEPPMLHTGTKEATTEMMNAGMRNNFFLSISRHTILPNR